MLKQVAGIDVAQDELVVSLGRLHDDLTPEVFAGKKFVNTPKGFEALELWVKKMADPKTDIHFIMEATGVYHEAFAYYLDGKGYQISIVLPSKISNYHRTLEIKTVTDQTSSVTITRFGLERKLETWKRPNPVFKKLRQLTRERDQLLQNRTIAKNQLHAEMAEAEPNKGTVGRIKKHIALLEKQESEIREEISLMIKENEQIKQLVDLLSTIPGVGLVTIVTVLAETNGFELIRNRRQLTSYAGLDVKEKLSGTSVKGKPRISKHGNRFLRKAMLFPAFAATRHDERFKAIFARLVSRHGIKMKAQVAIQRRLLELIFTLFKNKTPYDKQYLQKQQVVPFVV